MFKNIDNLVKFVLIDLFHAFRHDVVILLISVSFIMTSQYHAVTNLHPPNLMEGE